MSVERVSSKSLSSSSTCWVAGLLSYFEIQKNGVSPFQIETNKVDIHDRELEDDDMDMAGTKFNVLNHIFVPHQELIPAEDEEEELRPWGLLSTDEETGEPRLAKEILPKILITDPVVQVIKETVEREDMAKATEDEEHIPLPAGWIADRVLKVVRKSPSAGVSIAYRLIVEGK